MSQRFIRCVHCGMPHDASETICPSTGKTVEPDTRPVQSHSSPPPPNLPSRAAALTSLEPQSTRRDLIHRIIGGRYLVRGVLGEGGMGTVYEAEHTAIGGMVAVKVLHPSQARKKNATRRFHQEARAAAAIGHPNICEVYDLGTLQDGSPYLVMEKLVGETLADRIAAEGGLPFDDVIDILVQALSGLVAAHDKGIVHRDIKPENVFLTRRVGCPPVVKVLDFGMSKLIAQPLGGGREDDIDITRPGVVMGTPYYMAPEQARGESNIDARVDLYATGVILYEALTGQRPYSAPNYHALLARIVSPEPPRPARALRPALPNRFDAVIEKAMAPRKEDRYSTAAEFQRDLQSLRDRHNGPALGESLHALVQALEPPSATVRAAAPPRPSPPRPSPPRPGASAPPLRHGEPTPSSVEIPISFVADNAPTVENLDPTEPHASSSTDAWSSEVWQDEFPTETEVQSSPFPELRPEIEGASTGGIGGAGAGPSGRRRE